MSLEEQVVSLCRDKDIVIGLWVGLSRTIKFEKSASRTSEGDCTTGTALVRGAESGTLVHPRGQQVMMALSCSSLNLFLAGAVISSPSG